MELKMLLPIYFFYNKKLNHLFVNALMFYLLKELVCLFNLK